MPTRLCSSSAVAHAGSHRRATNHQLASWTDERRSADEGHAHPRVERPVAARGDWGPRGYHQRHGRYQERDRVMILLSVKAGLRAGEIAKLRWSMVLDARGRIGDCIELHDSAAKKGSGRTIPLHPELRLALLVLRRHDGAEGAVI